MRRGAVHGVKVGFGGLRGGVGGGGGLPVVVAGHHDGHLVQVGDPGVLVVLLRFLSEQTGKCSQVNLSCNAVFVVLCLLT